MSCFSLLVVACPARICFTERELVPISPTFPRLLQSVMTTLQGLCACADRRSPIKRSRMASPSSVSGSLLLAHCPSGPVDLSPLSRVISVLIALCLVSQRAPTSSAAPYPKHILTNCCLTLQQDLAFKLLLAPTGLLIVLRKCKDLQLVLRQSPHFQALLLVSCAFTYALVQLKENQLSTYPLHFCAYYFCR